jgi:N-acetylmuramoyl-L-alanine amidase
MMILVFHVVKSINYFRRPNKFLKLPRPVLLLCQTIASLSALGGAMASLVWLGHQVATLEKPRIGPWDAETQKIPVILVDAGHGGHDGGAVSNGGIEKHLTLAIAKQLRDELVAAGLRVVMTRETDTFLPLEERAALTKKHGAEAFVRVHITTDGSGSSANGIETYFAGKPSLSTLRQTGQKGENGTTSEKLAATVQRCVCQETRADNRGIKERDYVVIEEAASPAVLVECGFLTNPEEATRLKDEKHQEKIARGIAAGVKLFLQAKPAVAAVLAEK